jgi:hypothetical protein
VWRVLYRNKAGQEVTVTTITKPPKHRVFKAAGGLRKFTAVKATSTTKEMILVAKTSKKDKAITDDELEALAELDDLDTDGDSAKSSKKGGGKSTKTKAKAKAAKDGVGTADIAKASGTDGRTLRMYLRKAGIKVDSDRGRYWWPSLEDAEAKKIIKAVKGGAADKAKKESLDRLKASKAGKKGKDKKGKKSKKS